MRGADGEVDLARELVGRADEQRGGGAAHVGEAAAGEVVERLRVLPAVARQPRLEAQLAGGVPGPGGAAGEAGEVTARGAIKSCSTEAQACVDLADGAGHPARAEVEVAAAVAIGHKLAVERARKARVAATRFARGQRQADDAVGRIAHAGRHAVLAIFARRVGWCRVVGALMRIAALDGPARHHAQTHGAVEGARGGDVALQVVGHDGVVVEAHEAAVGHQVDAAGEALDARPVGTQLQGVALVGECRVGGEADVAQRAIATHALAADGLVEAGHGGERGDVVALAQAAGQGGRAVANFVQIGVVRQRHRAAHVPGARLRCGQRACAQAQTQAKTGQRSGSCSNNGQCINTHGGRRTRA